MDADPTVTGTLANAAQWLGGVVAGFFALIGIGKLAEMTLGRFFTKKDSKETIHETNQGKQIDADKDAFVIVAERLKIVEARLDKLQDDLTEQVKENAVLSANNANLQKENDRLHEEINKLREQRRESDTLIAMLRKELDILKLRVDGSITQAAPLDVHLVDGERNDRP